LPEEWYEALTEAGAHFLLWTNLRGRADVLTGAPTEVRPETFADFEVSSEDIPFEQAVEALRARLPIDSELFGQLEAALKFRAFTAARLGGQDLLARLQDVMAENIREGEGVAAFVERVGADELLEQSGFARKNPFYLETVYRTNTTTAYNAGRRAEFEELSEAIAMLEFFGIADGRQTDICNSYDGIRRPQDDPIWGVITPPNHFNCRSTVRAIYRGTSEAEELSPTPETETTRALQDEPPDEGFESAPTTPEELAEMPADVRERAEQFGILGDLQERRRELEI